MWIYEKKLEFPVHIKEPNPKLAQLIIMAITAWCSVSL